MRPLRTWSVGRLLLVMLGGALGAPLGLIAWALTLATRPTTSDAMQHGIDVIWLVSLDRLLIPYLGPPLALLAVWAYARRAPPAGGPASL